MKNYLILFFALFFCNLQAQSEDWSLFPFEQETYFLTQYRQIECYYANEMEQNGALSQYFFYQSPTLDFPCKDSIYSTMGDFRYHNYRLHKTPLLLDSNTGIASTIVFGDTLYFDPNAQVGAMISSRVSAYADFDTITFTCTGFEEKTMLICDILTYRVL